MPPAPVIFRRATAGDVPAIVALLRDDPLGATREREPGDAAYQEAFARIDRDTSELLVVGELDGAVVATLQLSFLPGLARAGSMRASIEAVRVASRLRGRGVGHDLFAWAIERARQEGATTIQLTSDNSRTGAHRFYEGLGFKPTHLGFKLAIPPG